MRSRERRLEDKLADAQHYLSKWGWSMPPSEIRSREERIEKLAHKLAAIRTETP